MSTDNVKGADDNECVQSPQRQNANTSIQNTGTLVFVYFSFSLTSGLIRLAYGSLSPVCYSYDMLQNIVESYKNSTGIETAALQ